MPAPVFEPHPARSANSRTGGARRDMSTSSRGSYTSPRSPGSRMSEFEPDRELRWLGRLLVPGIFDGEHILHIEPLDQTRSRFTQAERFSGILVRLFGSTLDKTELGFEQMNDALKARAERR